jgi:hypothetical protein
MTWLRLCQAARTGVKQLRVRGLKAVRFCATLKTIGINIFKATAVRRAINATRESLEGVHSSLYLHFLFSKNTLEYLERIRNIFTLRAYNYPFELKMAA